MLTTPIEMAVAGFGFCGPNVLCEQGRAARLCLAGPCKRDGARATDFLRLRRGCPVERELGLGRIPLEASP